MYSYLTYRCGVYDGLSHQRRRRHASLLTLTQPPLSLYCAITIHSHSLMIYRCGLYDGLSHQRRRGHERLQRQRLRRSTHLLHHPGPLCHLLCLLLLTQRYGKEEYKLQHHSFSFTYFLHHPGPHCYLLSLAPLIFISSPICSCFPCSFHFPLPGDGHHQHHLRRLQLRPAQPRRCDTSLT